MLQPVSAVSLSQLGEESIMTRVRETHHKILLDVVAPQPSYEGQEYSGPIQNIIILPRMRKPVK